MPPQQMITRPALIERVERTEVVMIRPQQRVEFAQQNPYIMKVNRSNRNCYNCEGFGDLARHCRNRGIENKIGKGRRLEDGGQRREKGGKGQSNLNGEGNLIVFD